MLRWMQFSALVIFLGYSNISLSVPGIPIRPTQENQLLAEADSLYKLGDYRNAFTLYEQLTASRISSGNNELKFKTAYSAWRSHYPEKAANLFTSLAEAGFLPDISTYFQIKSLWEFQPQSAESLSLSFLQSFGKSIFADSLLFDLADHYFNGGQYDQAFQFYQTSLKKASPIDYAWLRIRSAQALYYQKQFSAARELWLQILRSHPAETETLTALVWLEENDRDFYQDNFFNIIKVLEAHDEHNRVHTLLEAFIKSTADQAQAEQARFYLLKNYYDRREYQPALYGFQNMLKNLKHPSLEPGIRLQIARTYYASGQRSLAIDAYIDYADRFPRGRLAPEAVWKAAWIAEEQKKLELATSLYQKTYLHWPKSNYAAEAAFREGFVHFRQGRLEAARLGFEQMQTGKWSDVQRDRAAYWTARCYLLSGDTLKARQIFQKTGRELWDNYYSMKSFILSAQQSDSLMETLKKFSEAASPLLATSESRQKLWPVYEKIFLVQELLGSDYAMAMLEGIKPELENRSDWTALAELYKKLGSYGKAYRLYDYIDSKFFSELEYSEKPFMVRERFPLNFYSIIEPLADRYILEPALILAIIKQESVFEADALSRANAYGLMQLVPGTARDMARQMRLPYSNNRQLFKPEFNISLGVLYLKNLHRQFDGDKAAMLAAYNAGPSRAQRWQTLEGSDDTDVFIENIEYSETRDYVRKVLKNYWAYTLLSGKWPVQN